MKEKKERKKRKQTKEKKQTKCECEFDRCVIIPIDTTHTKSVVSEVRTEIESLNYSFVIHWFKPMLDCE